MRARRTESGLGAGPVAVFLDRDGVINRKPAEGSYVTSWSDFAFLPGTLEALRLLAERDVLTIVVTNQRAVSRGLLTSEDLARIHRNMVEAIDATGGRIDAVLTCEHDEGVCACRKPATGLFLQAQARFPSIDFAKSVVVGDSATDLEPGHRLGCRAVLLGAEPRRRQELLRLETMGVRVSGVAATLLEAVTEHVLPTATLVTG